MSEIQATLFGDTELPDRFATAQERYGVWPTTVWECNFQDPVLHTLKGLIGDDGEAREGCFTKVQGGGPGACYRPGKGQDASCYRGKVTSSIFNPAVAAWALNMYAPASGVCYDPFAGGGTRAIMAAKRGLQYVGVELRAAEVEAVRQRLARAGINGAARIVEGDSRDATHAIGAGEADFLLTCPPYWNLEQYEGGEQDLSMLPTYRAFCDALGVVIADTARALKRGSHAVWVVGLHRTPKGELLAMNHDVALLHRQAGFTFKEEVVLFQKNNGAIQRVGNFEKGSKRLVRVHEYLLVFVR